MSNFRFYAVAFFLSCALAASQGSAASKTVSSQATYLIQLNTESIAAALASDPVLTPYLARRKAKEIQENKERRQRRDEIVSRQQLQIRLKKNSLKRTLLYLKANKILNSFEHVLVGCVVPDLTKAQVRRLRARGYRVEEQRPLRVASDSLDEATQLIRSDETNTIPSPSGGNLIGTGVTVAILDTGADLAHQDLGSCYWNSTFNKRTFESCPRFAFIKKVTSTGTLTTTPAADPFRHGTHVASILLGNKGVAKGATLATYLVCSSDTNCPSNAILGALEDIAKNLTSNSIDVVNMSIESTVAGSPLDAVSVAVDNLVSLGVVVVAAAGNGGPNSSSTISTPGTARRAITVGSTNLPDGDSEYVQVAASSSVGSATMLKPDLVAPGQQMEGTYGGLCGALTTYGVEQTYYNNNSGAVCDVPPIPASTPNYQKLRHIKISGTSMAAPQVAGAAALLLQKYPGLSPEEVKATLMRTADKRVHGDAYSFGAGRLDVYNAVVLESAENDADNDGITNASDNCVNVANPDQEKASPGDSFGKACSFALRGTVSGCSNSVVVSACPIRNSIPDCSSAASVQYDCSTSFELDVPEASEPQLYSIQATSPGYDPASTTINLPRYIKGSAWTPVDFTLVLKPNGPNTLSFEAEAFYDLALPVEVHTDSDASSGAALKRKGTGRVRITPSISIPAPGTYSLWVRAKNIGSARLDGLILGIASSALTIDSFSDSVNLKAIAVPGPAYSWFGFSSDTSPLKYALAQDTYILTLYFAGAIAVDRLILTDDPSYVPDGADPDPDGDGIGNSSDNCPNAANRLQKDTDSDGSGDVCDPDDDGDSVPDASDNCSSNSNYFQSDNDSDGKGDACDNCENVSNADQEDTDTDGVGDACSHIINGKIFGCPGPNSPCGGVSVSAGATSTTTDVDGNFQLHFSPTLRTPYIIETSKQGFETASATLSLPPVTKRRLPPVDLDLILKPAHANYISFEAEDMDTPGALTQIVTDEPLAWARAYIMNGEAPTHRSTHSLSIPRAGAYTLWVRATNAGTLLLGIEPGALDSANANDAAKLKPLVLPPQAESSFVWTGVAFDSLQEGENVLTLYFSDASSAAVDSFILTDDAAFVPPKSPPAADAADWSLVGTMTTQNPHLGIDMTDHRGNLYVGAAGSLLKVTDNGLTPLATSPVPSLWGSVQLASLRTGIDHKRALYIVTTDHTISYPPQTMIAKVKDDDTVGASYSLTLPTAGLFNVLLDGTWKVLAAFDHTSSFSWVRQVSLSIADSPIGGSGWQHMKYLSQYPVAAMQAFTSHRGHQYIAGSSPTIYRAGDWAEVTVSNYEAGKLLLSFGGDFHVIETALRSAPGLQGPVPYIVTAKDPMEDIENWNPLTPTSFPANQSPALIGDVYLGHMYLASRANQGNADMISKSADGKAWTAASNIDVASHIVDIHALNGDLYAAIAVSGGLKVEKARLLKPAHQPVLSSISSVGGSTSVVLTANEADENNVDVVQIRYTRVANGQVKDPRVSPDAEVAQPGQSISIEPGHTLYACATRADLSPGPLFILVN